jgi:23S rRNA (cytidine1920-2'-O)/16S rRNA (cytidine1409-2'-O)-methyltransferase
MRLDQALVSRGLADSRTKAQSLIREGFVTVAGTVQKKPSLITTEDDEIIVKGELHPWVGRGGMKLDYAITHYALDINGQTCLDLGASTGGFTDVMLHYGAAKVYAVDVGHDQLHAKLCGDSRVVNLEGLHAKDITADHVPDEIDFLAADLSFISVTKALPFVFPLLSPRARLVVLIKPQFEAGREAVGKGGVVKDEAAQKLAVGNVLRFLQESGFLLSEVIPSPIAGGDGNREFLVMASRP